jgi:hypothetical protein
MRLHEPVSRRRMGFPIPSGTRSPHGVSAPDAQKGNTMRILHLGRREPVAAEPVAQPAARGLQSSETSPRATLERLERRAQDTIRSQDVKAAAVLTAVGLILTALSLGVGDRLGDVHGPQAIALWAGGLGVGLAVVALLGALVSRGVLARPGWFDLSPYGWRAYTPAALLAALEEADDRIRQEALMAAHVIRLSRIAWAKSVLLNVAIFLLMEAIASTAIAAV